MEVYAGFLEHVDHHVGRLTDALSDLGILDDTLVIYILGDNGASAEGTINGSFNEYFMFNGAMALETPGSPPVSTSSGPRQRTTTMPSAGPTPWMPRTSGRSRSPRTGVARATEAIVQWPNGIKAKGEIRNQFHHVIDIAATVLEAAGLAAPTFVNGVQQMPLHGVSMAYSFDEPAAPERHETQYFEMFVNRGIYHEAGLP